MLLAPFEVFSHAILARTWFPDLLCWSAAAAAIDLGLLAVILKLDADYLESAAAISQKLYERLQRMKQGGGFAMPASEKAARIRVRPFPWLGGCRAAGMAAVPPGDPHIQVRSHLDLLCGGGAV